MKNATGGQVSPPISQKRRFFEPPTRILIMSAPRTGSTAVLHVLENMGAGHDPDEDMHSHLVAERGITRANALAYIQKIAMKKGTDTGFFTSKVHFNQLASLFGRDPHHCDPWLKYFNRFILLRRRDRLAQAISEFFSTKSQVWTLMTETPEQPLNAREFSAEDLVPVTGILSRQMAEELNWLSLNRDLDLQSLEIFYEDFVASPDEVARKIADYIGITASQNFKAALRTRKVSESGSVERFREAYLAELGRRHGLVK
ncbi:MAG: Stf0 sulfotransferase family protein [Aestuariivirgaceae bacterium]|nr:Stf0 sulfotransferase family protein [Aestuariivirgaceae bacterium]